MSGEGIYRKVSMRLWSDEKFRRLTSSGKYLWLYLLIGPHTTSIPGIFVMGKAAMAEALGWTGEAFGEAFAELLREGLIEFDAETRLWFVRNAIRHNMPPNPNVVQSWQSQWLLLPECQLRARICEHFSTVLSQASSSLGERFDKHCRNASANPSLKPSPNPSRKGSGKQEAGTGTGKRSARRLPKTSLPEGFGISERVRQWAAEKGHGHLDERLEAFLSYVRAHGATYVDWDEALMKAVREEWGPGSKTKTNGTDMFAGSR